MFSLACRWSFKDDKSGGAENIPQKPTTRLSSFAGEGLRAFRIGNFKFQILNFKLKSICGSGAVELLIFLDLGLEICS